MERSSGIEGLFATEYPRLVRALAVAFGEASAADAVQEAFVAADLRWAKVGGLADPAGWIRRVALNRLLNGTRDERRRSEILSAHGRMIAPPDPERADLVDLDAALRALPDRMRAAVVLHYLADLSVADVATALGIADGTVKSSLHDARARLRVALEVLE